MYWAERNCGGMRRIEKMSRGGTSIYEAGVKFFLVGLALWVSVLMEIRFEDFVFYGLL